MDQDIITRLELTETEYKGERAFKDSNGLIFSPLEHSPGLVMVIDSKSRAHALMSETELQYIRKEVLYYAIVTTITDRI